MSKKKSELKSTVEELRARLAKAEARAERWKARAKQAESERGEASQAADPADDTLPEQRIGQVVTETLRVLTTTLDDVVTNARAAFEDLASGKRADAEAPVPPTTRPAWPPAATSASENGSPDPKADKGVYDDPRSS